MYFRKAMMAAGVFALGLTGLAGLTAAPANADTIRMSGFTWPGAVVVQNLVTNVLESRLGYDVEIVSVDIAAGMAAMCKGDGSIDVQVDFWMPNHQEKWNNYIAEGSKECVRAGANPYVGVQGLFIPGYVQDEYGIKSVADLADPKIAELFDSDGDGKGEWWPGPAGWGSTNIGLVKAKSYGFGEYIDAFVVSEAAFKAKFETDYARGKPVLFFYWTPEWLFAKYDLRKLEEPPFDGYAMQSKKDDANYKSDGCWDMYHPKDDPDWLEKSTVTCAFPDAMIYVTYSATLAERAPDVVRFMDQLTLNADLVSQWILQMEVDGRDPAELTKEWMENNSETVDAWLSGI